MTRKFILTLLVMVVFAGLALFAPSQVGAQPSTTTDCLQCPNGDLGRTVFDADGNIVEAYWCEPGNVLDAALCICDTDPSTGDSLWIPLRVEMTLYACDSSAKGDCRLVQNTSLGAACGSFGRMGGWPYCPDTNNNNICDYLE